MDRQEHWENVYQTKGRDEVSWFREHLDTSLRMIEKTGVGKNVPVIDVGGGNSNLADDLLDAGFVDISVLDISGKALADSQERLSADAAKVTWIEADITEANLPSGHYGLWHDRAVFHFLTDPADRRKYADLVERSVKDGGHIIAASFGIDGPQKCSGLNVVRYAPESMQAEFGDSFDLIESITETHYTPFGTTQEFIYCHFRKMR